MANDNGLLFREHVALREELHNLKECQFKFLTFAVTSTAVLLGLAASISDGAPIAYMFPLAILIPSWWIFFDKATTITRIVGYFRLLEKRIIKEESLVNYEGWENSLAIFRKRQKSDDGSQKNEEIKSAIVRFLGLIFLRTTNRYWVLTYYTFFGLTWLCWGLSYYKGGSFWVIISAAVVAAVSSLWNASVVWGLVEGRYSYDNNENRWEKILEIMGVDPARD